MAHRNDPVPVTALAISAGLSLLVIALGWTAVETLSVDRLISRLVWPLLRLIAFIALGLAIGQAIEAAGWTRRLAALAAPLFRFGRMGVHGAAAFTAAFFSGVAANAMLLEFYQTDKITRRQLFLANLMNQVPAFFLHLPSTFFIVIPLTGRAGLLYFLLTFAALAARTVLVMIYGRITGGGEAAAALPPETVPAPQSTSSRTAGMWATIRRRLPERLLRIVIYVVPIYALVFMINAMGGFEIARQWLARLITTRVLPVEALSVVILSFAAEFTTGFAAAGALMEAGVLTVKQTVIALLAGNIVAFPVRALRHQLPRYMGIFAPQLGLQLLLLGQGLRVLSLIGVGVAYYWLT